MGIPACCFRHSNGVVRALFCLALLTLLLLCGCTATTNTPDGSVRVSGTQSTGNISHNQLLALGANAQASLLGQTVNEGCTGEYAFFMGLDKETNDAFWSVRCTNGKSYSVQIKPNATGSTNIMDCEVLKAIAKVSCFVKLRQQ